MLRVLPNFQTPYRINMNNNLAFRGNDETKLPDCINEAVKKYCTTGITPDFIINKLRKKTDPLRVQHCISVSQKASEIAEEQGLNPEKAALAGLVHDYAKGINEEKLLKNAQGNSIPLMPEEKARPSLLHAPVGACLIQEELGITDPEILNAVKNHGIGSRNPEEPLFPLDTVLIVADKIESIKENDTTKDKVAQVLEETGCPDLAAATAFSSKVASRMEKFQPIDLTYIHNYNNLVTHV